MNDRSSFDEDVNIPSVYVARPEEEALQQSVREPGVTFVVGRAGTGKTTLLYRLVDKLRADNEREVLVFSPWSESREGEHPLDVISTAQDLRDAVIIVDEAHGFARHALLDILQTGIAAGAHVVVSAQEEIYADILQSIPALERRIRIIKLTPLSRAQADELLRKRTGDDYDRVRSALEGLQEPSPHEVLRAAAKLLEEGEQRSGVPLTPFIAPLEIVIEPGDCTAADLANFYTALSNVYRAYGGDGLEFVAEGDRIFVREGSAI